MNTINVPYRTTRREPTWLKVVVLALVTIEWLIIGYQFIPRW